MRFNAAEGIWRLGHFPSLGLLVSVSSPKIKRMGSISALESQKRRRDRTNAMDIIPLGASDSEAKTKR